eukprot:365776-Chlamydomonas_euryale.AAC.5
MQAFMRQPAMQSAGTCLATGDVITIVSAVMLSHMQEQFGGAAAVRRATGVERGGPVLGDAACRAREVRGGGCVRS